MSKNTHHAHPVAYLLCWLLGHKWAKTSIRRGPIIVHHWFYCQRCKQRISLPKPH